MKLNLGCGKDIRQGWINLDRINLPGVDVIYDINELPLPFDAETFDEILCSNILEHILKLDLLLKDLNRILKHGGRLKIQVPHFTSSGAFVDPTHVRYFAIQTLFFFVNHSCSYYYDFSFSKIEKYRITFKKIPYFYNYLIEPLVNINLTTMKAYENSFLRIFPAYTIDIELIK